MSNKDWQVGPVLKDKMGSQGTLFRGGTKYSSPQRFPRGYTPERQAAVRDAVKSSESGPVTDMQDFIAGHKQRLKIADTIARSTVPHQHLQGVQWAHVRPWERLTAATEANPNDSAGAYFKPHRNRPDAGMIAVREPYQDTSTVIHELGHHISYLQGTEHSRNYSYEHEHGGTEEAFADNYAEQHFRDRKGNPVERGTYGGGQYAGRIQRSNEFWEGYHKQRDSSMYREHVERENEKYYGAWPEEKIHPDDSQDVPLIEKEWISPDDRARGVKPEININPDAEPEHWSSKYAW